MDKKGYYEISRDINKICSNSKRVKLSEKKNDKELSEPNFVDAEIFEECFVNKNDSDCTYLSESNSYSDFSCENEKEISNIGSEIAKWFIEFRISEAAGNGLLKVLRNFHPSLPQNIKTLKKIPKENSTDIISMGDGHYSYIGLRKKLEKHVSIHKLKEFVVKIDIGIDGVPLTKSSNSQLWPILANIIPFKEIFLVGIFHGYKKPACANAFIQPFVDEMQELKKNPIIYEGNPVKIQIRAFICDSPARSFILGE